MTDLRTAAQQALEALEQSATTVPYEGFGMVHREAERKHQAAIAALRAALAQQAWICPESPEHRYAKPGHCEDCGRTLVLAQQAKQHAEPAAWIQPDHLQKARVAPFLCRVEPTKRCADFVPFWTAPPQRKPLTQEEITTQAEKVLKPSVYHDAEALIGTDGLVALVRAVEQAHNIKE